jgi:1-acyl-sn-glycerol-3-phosphate acyltransferase
MPSQLTQPQAGLASVHRLPASQGASSAGPFAPLARRVAAVRAQPAAHRDPGFIRRQLPAIERYTSYFTPEVRGADRLPADGPVLVVGNHSCLFYMPEVWVCGEAIMDRRGVNAPAYLLAYDLLFAIPGIGDSLRRLGAMPAHGPDAAAALADGACVTVYPGGDFEACRPWTQRNRVEFAGRMGFVRLALRSGVPVVPVVAHGGQHAVVVLSRGDRLARAAGLRNLRVNVFPFLLGPPLGITPVIMPPLPMPAHLTVEFLPALDWSGYGAAGAADPDVVQACYTEITGVLQAALDRLAAEHPMPLVEGCSRLASRLASGALRLAGSTSRVLAG